MIFAHPLLLWALAAVAIPLAIHLLLRQRPRPRPWAAMRWLEAAARRAQRRWQLTNLLLLLLRLLAVVLLVLACARPFLPGQGPGGRLVVVVDRTASLGTRSSDPGPLAALAAEFSRSECSFSRVAVVAMDGQAELLADGSAAAAQEALSRLESSGLPGGLDDLDDEGLAVLRRACGDSRPTVLLVSDFQQDRGERLVAALGEAAGPVLRWSPSDPLGPGQNAGVLDVTVGDLLPGAAGEVVARIEGQATTVRVGVDGGPALAVPVDLSAASAGGTVGTGAREVRLPLPPLPAGTHRLLVELTDHGVLADNRLELPITVREPVPGLVVAAPGTPDYLAAALGSDARATSVRSVAPAFLASETLVPGGLVALRAQPAAAEVRRLAAWVRDGGVLWAELDLLNQDPALADLVTGVVRGSAAAGGPWILGEALSPSASDGDLNRLLAFAGRDTLPTTTLPRDAAIGLRAGTVPAVAAVPAGRGWVVLELVPLIQDPVWQARGATPLWSLRMARSITARAARLERIESGTAAPTALTLMGQGLTVECAAGARLRAVPGPWQRSDGTPLLVLPNREEIRLDRPLPTDASGSLKDRITRTADREAGPWPLLALLLVLAIETWFAGRAGRAYA